MGNPALKPERGYNGELGIALATDRLEANASTFMRYARDGIQWTGMSLSNIGEALYPGAEASFDIELLPGLSLRGSYTFLYSFVLKGASATYTFEDDKRAIYSPLHTADAALRYEKGNTRLGADARFSSDRFTKEDNSVSLPGSSC